MGRRRERIILLAGVFGWAFVLVTAQSSSSSAPGTSSLNPKPTEQSSTSSQSKVTSSSVAATTATQNNEKTTAGSTVASLSTKPAAVTTVKQDKPTAPITGQINLPELPYDPAQSKMTLAEQLMKLQQQQQQPPPVEYDMFGFPISPAGAHKLKVNTPSVFDVINVMSSYPRARRRLRRAVLYRGNTPAEPHGHRNHVHPPRPPVHKTVSPGRLRPPPPPPTYDETMYMVQQYDTTNNLHTQRFSSSAQHSTGSAQLSTDSAHRSQSPAKSQDNHALHQSDPALSQSNPEQQTNGPVHTLGSSTRDRAENKRFDTFRIIDTKPNPRPPPRRTQGRRYQQNSHRKHKVDLAEAVSGQQFFTNPKTAIQSGRATKTSRSKLGHQLSSFPEVEVPKVVQQSPQAVHEVNIVDPHNSHSGPLDTLTDQTVLSLALQGHPETNTAVPDQLALQDATLSNVPSQDMAALFDGLAAHPHDAHHPNDSHIHHSHQPNGQLVESKNAHSHAENQHAAHQVDQVHHDTGQSHVAIDHGHSPLEGHTAIHVVDVGPHTQETSGNIPHATDAHTSLETQPVPNDVHRDAGQGHATNSIVTLDQAAHSSDAYVPVETQPSLHQGDAVNPNKMGQGVPGHMSFGHDTHQPNVHNVDSINHNLQNFGPDIHEASGPSAHHVNEIPHVDAVYHDIGPSHGENVGSQVHGIDAHGQADVQPVPHQESGASQALPEHEHVGQPADRNNGHANQHVTHVEASLNHGQEHTAQSILDSNAHQSHNIDAHGPAEGQLVVLGAGQVNHDVGHVQQEHVQHGPGPGQNQPQEPSPQYTDAVVSRHDPALTQSKPHAVGNHQTEVHQISRGNPNAPEFEAQFAAMFDNWYNQKFSPAGSASTGVQSSQGSNDKAALFKDFMKMFKNQRTGSMTSQQNTNHQSTTMAGNGGMHTEMHSSPSSNVHHHKNNPHNKMNNQPKNNRKGRRRGRVKKIVKRPRSRPTPTSGIPKAREIPHTVPSTVAPLEMLPVVTTTLTPVSTVSTTLPTTTFKPTVDPDVLADVNEARSYQGLPALKPHQVDIHGNIKPRFRNIVNRRRLPGVRRRLNLLPPLGHGNFMHHQHDAIHREAGHAMSPELHRQIHRLLRIKNRQHQRRNLFGVVQPNPTASPIDPDLMADIMEAAQAGGAAFGR